MPQYKVLLGPIATDEVFQTGDTIELSETNAKPLIDLKVIQPIASAKPEDKSEQEAEVSKPSAKPAKSTPKTDA